MQIQLVDSLYAGLWRRVRGAGISKTINCQPVVRYCVFSDRAYQNSIELFIPIVHALRNNLAVSRNILRKWQPPIEADYMAQIPQSRSSSFVIPL